MNNILEYYKKKGYTECPGHDVYLNDKLGSDTVHYTKKTEHVSEEYDNNMIYIYRNKKLVFKCCFNNHPQKVWDNYEKELFTFLDSEVRNHKLNILMEE